MADKYIHGFREAIKNSKADEEVDTVLNRVYEDGFDDGSKGGE